MAKATFDDFKPQIYEFEVITPDGDVIEFEMRALTPAELLAIDITHARPDPRVYEIAPPKRKGDAPTPKYTSDDDAPPAEKAEWTKQVTEWMQEHRNIQIVRALQMDIPGETDAERVDALKSLGAWAISAFSQALNLVSSTPKGALNAHSFRGVGSVEDEVV